MSMTKRLPHQTMELFRESGREGQKIGGKGSLQTITDEQRSEPAQEAAAAAAEVLRTGASQYATAENVLAPRRTPTSKSQALILADEILNRLNGYASKGSPKRRDFYRRDLNWIAEVVMRIEAGERDLLRPTGQLPI